MSKIFFSGIGGSGISAIAGFSADRGHIVSGSDRLFDRNPDHPICNILKGKGITIVPQDGTGIVASLDLVVFSTAVEDDQPDIRRAREKGITMKSRPEYLSELAAEFNTVAVAGTSGKSTSAGMFAFLLKRLGLEPNFIGGGRVKQFMDRNNLGNVLAGKSDLLVIEACESDGSVVRYHPLHSIVANLDLDHNPIEQTAGMFETLGENTKEILIVNRDDRNLKRCRFRKATGFSIDSISEYQVKAITLQPLGTTFALHNVPFTLSLPGKYNLYNALSCIALLSEMGISLRDVADVLPDFSGIERRFDICLNDGKHLVVDDYAHNPHKISSLMETVAGIRDRVCYIFQPHGFGPTRLMKHGYVGTFIRNLRREDQLMLLPIYYAGGTSIKDISSEDLSAEIRRAGKSAEVLQERKLLFQRILEWDNYVVMGARDESLANFAREIALRLQGK